MTAPARQIPTRYGIALVAVLLAVLLRLALDPVLRQASPFMLLVPAVMISAWYGGMGPGLLATCLGAAAGDYFLLEPAGFSRTVHNLSRVGVFSLVGVQISWLSGALHRARGRAEGEARAARESERTARESEQRYRTLAANFPNGAVFLFDRDLRLLLADGTGLAAAGVSREQVEGKTVRDAFPPDVVERVTPLYRSALSGEAPAAEVYHRGRTYLIQAVPLRDADGGVYAGLAMTLDVTERVQVREDLRRARDELELRVRERTAELAYQKTLLESQSEASLDAILVVSDDRHVVYHNRRLVELWRMPEAALAALPAPLGAFVQPMRDRLATDQDPLTDSHPPYPCPEGEPHTELVLKGDRSLECYSAPVVSKDGTSYGRVWFFRDITERKRLEREVLDVSEREQRRIGQDLHDGLGQHLTGIGLIAKGIERRLRNKSADDEARDVAEVAEMVGQAVAQARDLARGLRPVALAADGLATGLQELARVVEKAGDVRVQLHADSPADPLSDTEATHLYRIAQEAVNNAVKHGKPTRIAIALADSGDGVRLTVEDDGVGLPPEQQPGHQGMGLQIMQHRARMIGAIFAIRRRAGGGGGSDSSGTVVDVLLPREGKG